MRGPAADVSFVAQKTEKHEERRGGVASGGAYQEKGGISQGQGF